MRPRPIINDALWACLCPRYNRPLSVLAQPSGWRPRAGPSNHTHEPKRFEQFCRYSTRPSPAIATYNAHDGDNFSPNVADPRPSPLDSGTRPRCRPVEKAAPVSLSTPELYELLRHHGARGDYDKVFSIVKILVKDRKERPNTRLYATVLHSFTDSENGTAGKLRKELEEMAEAGIELDDVGAECALEALAVHPDYLLRADILQYARERWFNMPTKMHSFVVVGMLRDRLFEQALEKLEELIHQRIPVEPWVWDKTLWTLLEFGEVEEAFHVLELRQSVDGPAARISNALWLHMLDAAGRYHLTEAARSIWNAQVIPGNLKPPSGTCMHVLSAAARAGMVTLATDVFRTLSERNTVFTSHQYESLLECYLTAGDVPGALSVVLIMSDSRIKFTQETLHPLFTYLSQEPSDPQRPITAFKHLQTLHVTGKRRKIPVTVVNTCMQACIALSRLSDAVEIYKALRTVCPTTGPNTMTFNILFQGCHREKRKELAMYLAQEMTTLELKPDRITYDRLVLVCVVTGDVEDALRYYEELKGHGWTLRRASHEALLNAVIDENRDQETAGRLAEDYRADLGALLGEGRLAMFDKKVALMDGAGNQVPLVEEPQAAEVE